MGTIHIVGAGLAGLACAVRLSRAGRRVVIHEAARQAGGRCRSYHDPVLDTVIDNGNHLLMRGNRAALSYLDAIGAADRLVGPERAVFPFVDLRDGRRWTIRPNGGAVPWWLFVPSRRAPSTRPLDYLGLAGFAVAGARTTVADVVPETHALYRPFAEPLTVAVLNTQPEKASARQLWAVLRRTFLRGEAYCRPLIARRGLADCFVDPAFPVLERAGAELRFGARVGRIAFGGERAAALEFGNDRVGIGPSDTVVLAVRPSVAAGLLPGLKVPTEGDPIVNAHFRLATPVTLPEDVPVLGVLGGTVQWVFVRDGIASVTVSAAHAEAEQPSEQLGPLLWRETAAALGIAAEPLPDHRVVKERRATFIQTPDNQRRRPPTRTRYANVLLAGDWTATGLPATIEGAITSGHTAAQAALRAA